MRMCRRRDACTLPVAGYPTDLNGFYHRPLNAVYLGRCSVRLTMYCCSVSLPGTWASGNIGITRPRRITGYTDAIRRASANTVPR